MRDVVCPTTARRRHVPIRSCVVCGNKTSKRELTRIVATPLGTVSIDPTGRLPGRGAYICRDEPCLDKGLKKGRLEYALRTKLTDEDWSELVSSVEASTAEG